MASKTTLKTDQVMHALSLWHDPKEWSFFEELRIGTGWGKDKEQRFDAYAINLFPSRQNVTRCYELKSSRSDFLKELATPIKRRAGVRLSNEFYFVTSKGLTSIEEIPVECGLIEVDDTGKLSITIHAPFRNIMPPTMSFLASLARRIDKERAALIGAELAALQKRQEEADSAVKVIDRHIKKWKEYSFGNKEVPDKIAVAIESLKEDVIEFLKGFDNLNIE